MKQLFSKNLVIAIVAILCASCGGSGSSKTTDPVPVIPSPEKVTLIFPDKDALCTQGIINGSQSTITFKWNKAANTDSYDIVIKNLLSGANNTYTTTSVQQDISLDLSSPYSWYITSKSNKTTATTQSDTWRFYNSGPGTISHAPYPAEIISPSQNQSVTATSGIVTLNWNGTDVDNDIVGYDIYLDTNNSPSLLKSAVTSTKLDASVISGKLYYWKIITKDSKGNTSDSGIFQFNTK